MNDVFQFNIYDIYGQISERVRERERERERGGRGEGALKELTKTPDKFNIYSYRPLSVLLWL